MYPINGLTQWLPLSSVRAERPGTTECNKYFNFSNQKGFSSHTMLLPLTKASLDSMCEALSSNTPPQPERLGGLLSTMLHYNSSRTLVRIMAYIANDTENDSIAQ